MTVMATTRWRYYTGGSLANGRSFPPSSWLCGSQISTPNFCLVILSLVNCVQRISRTSQYNRSNYTILKYMDSSQTVCGGNDELNIII